VYYNYITAAFQPLSVQPRSSVTKMRAPRGEVTEVDSNMPFATMTAARDFTARFMENRRRTGAAPTRKGDGAPQTSK
jgi:hypothetical protein